MTLILTCLTHEHITQVADRRLTSPDGGLCDDDTNKAVFYSGRVAMAYTGLAQMEGKPTAEWIGSCMKDEAETESAMNRVAKQAELHLWQTNQQNKRLAVVATGWATLRGAEPIRPFICVASNFMTDSWGWRRSADKRMVVRTIFLDESSPFLVFAAGQKLKPGESIYLNRLVRQAVKHGATARAPARLLGDMVQSVARGRDKRADRVGRAMIIHVLSRKALLDGRRSIMAPLTPDAHSFLYVSPEGRTDRFKAAVIASKGALLTGFGGGTIPPGGKGVIRTEMETSARQQPIQVPSNEIRYSSPCPFCAADVRTPQIVEGELPLTDMEAWIHCRGATGHLLLIQRERA